MGKEYTFLQLGHYKDFRCSGGACNLNCCNYNWEINVDKGTYLKYRAVATPKEFVDKLNKYVKRNRQSKTDVDYAKIVKTVEELEVKFTTVENGKKIEKTEKVASTSCIFQDENKLCGIYKYMGAEGLCSTCQAFPRIENNIFNNYERGLSLGCEEVSKLLYNLKDGVTFEQVTIDKLDRIIENYQVDLRKIKSPIRNYYDEIRVMCIRILQLNELSMDNRMILLGAFMFKIDEILETKNYESISNYIDEFAKNIDVYEPLMKIDTTRQDQFLEMFLKIGIFISGKGGRADINFTITNILAKFKKALTNEKNKKKITSIKFENKELINQSEKKDEEVNNEVLENPLEILENGSVISKNYTKYKQNVQKLMEDKQYYIENIFVHLFFVKGYPYNGKDRMKDIFIKFAWSYCYYKGIITGEMGELDELDEDLLHYLCTIFGRTCADQEAGLNIILKNIKDNNLDNLAFLTVLIKSA